MSKIDSAKVVELYSSGLSSREIASILDYGATSVKRILKKEGISRNPKHAKNMKFEKKCNILTKEYLVNEYVNKLRTIRDISKELKINAQYLGKRLNYFGITKHKYGRKGHKNKTQTIYNIGDIINNIKIEEIYDILNRIYLCKCHCGKNFEIDHTNIKRIKSCGCLLFKNGTNHHLWKGTGNIPISYFRKLETRSLEKNLEFNIDYEYIDNLLTNQKNLCAISNVDIYLNKFNKTASLDRIDSSKGYIKGNVHWVHKTINQMKWDIDLSNFIEWCRKIVNNNPAPNF